MSAGRLQDPSVTSQIQFSASTAGECEREDVSTGRPEASASLPRILISGWAGAGNVGDELATRAAVAMVRRAGGEPVVASRDPAATAALHGVEAVARGLRGLVAAARCDGVCVGPGGILQDSTSIWSLPAHLAAALTARVLRKPVVGLGLGAEPLQRRSSRWMVRRALGSGPVTVRDQPSAEALAAAGVRAEIAPDLVFTLDLEPRPASEELVVAVGPDAGLGRLTTAAWRLARADRHLAGVPPRDEFDPDEPGSGESSAGGSGCGRFRVRRRVAGWLRYGRFLAGRLLRAARRAAIDEFRDPMGFGSVLRHAPGGRPAGPKCTAAGPTEGGDSSAGGDVAGLAVALDRLSARHGLRVVFVAFRGERDRRYVQRVAAAMAEPSALACGAEAGPAHAGRASRFGLRASEATTAPVVDAAVERVLGAAALVTSRYHAAVVGLCGGVPVAVLSEQAKLAALVEEIDDPRRISRAGGLSSLEISPGRLDPCRPADHEACLRALDGLVRTAE